MKICVLNLGCKVNQYECDSLTASLIKLGHTVSDELSVADCYLINTCAVTKEAERKSRQYIGKVLKLNPRAKVFVIGCAAEKNPEQFSMKGVTFVSGTAAKEKVLDFVGEGVHIEPLPTEYEEMAEAKNFRARAYVKIEDGCNNFCSYCIIPYLRGRVRSRKVESILEECQNAALSTDEIVLTGINISAYGTDIGSSFAELIAALSVVPARIRLGSIEVGVIDEAFLQAIVSAGNVCPHFHLSLQSGSDTVLKAMNRHYTTEEFAKKVELIRSYFPQAAITTDIIVGFPAESEENFEETLAFARSIGFSDIHVFPYSRRSGTAAYPLGALDPAVVKSRADRLIGLKAELKRSYESLFVGRRLEVVIERTDGVFAEGHSENYIRVYVPDREQAIGKKIIVTIQGEHADGLVAE